MDQKLLSHLDNGVLTLSLNRPAKKNAIDNELWLALRDAFNAASENSEVRCVILTGEGDCFCAGVDLSSFGDSGGESQQSYDAAARVIVDFDKPLIGAAKGIAVGGGATILFHCDILYVGESLRMRLPFVSLGLVPEFASSYVLQAKIGMSRAAELFYTAEWIDAERALDTGIATSVYADNELMELAITKAREIAKWPVNSLRETKRCLKVAHKVGIDAALIAEDAGMQKQGQSPENIEAIMAFLEKREPDFSKIN